MSMQSLQLKDVLQWFNTDGMDSLARDLFRKVRAHIDKNRLEAAAYFAESAFRERTIRKSRRDSVDDHRGNTESGIWSACLAVVYALQERFDEASEQAKDCCRWFNRDTTAIPTNFAIARVLLSLVSQARLEHLKAAPAVEWTLTLRYFAEAIESLERVIRELRRRGDHTKPEREEWQLRHNLLAGIREEITKAFEAIGLRQLAERLPEKVETPEDKLNRISLPNLLRLIPMDNDNVTVRDLCWDAEGLRRRRVHIKAIQQAERAVSLARKLPGANSSRSLEGKALLYLSLARLTLNNPEAVRQAAAACNDALELFQPDTHYHLIALAFLAQIKWQMQEEEEALACFEMVAGTLDKLLKPGIVQGDTERKAYQDIKSAVEEAISRLRDDLLERKSGISPVEGREPSTEPEVQESQAAQIDTSAPIAAQPALASARSGTADQLSKTLPGAPLAIQLMRLESVAVYNSLPIGASSKSDAPGSFEIKPTEYLAATQFSIKGKLFSLRWIEEKANRNGELRLREAYKYIVVQVKGDSMEPTIANDEYVLVRLQEVPDRDRQIVVVSTGSWSDGMPSNVLVKRLRRSATKVELVSDNEKYPPIPFDQSSANADENLTMIGVVEAKLTQAQSN